MLAIRTRELSHSFGQRPVVSGLALEVPAGRVYGFLGRNGAGKTTTIRLLLGLIEPDAGAIELFGRPLTRASRRALAGAIGALVEVPPHYDHLTARENLEVTRRMRRLPAGEIARVLDLTGLTDSARRRVREFSLGMRQRLGLARALLGRPRLLILDEPTNGLDPGGIIAMRALLRRLAEEEGATVFLSSHLLGEIEQVADSVGLIDGGRLVAQGPVAELLDPAQTRLEIAAEPAGDAIAVLAAAGLAAERAGGGLLAVREPAEPAAVAALLVASGCAVSHLACRKPSLEDVYRQFTAGGEATKEPALC